MAQGGGVRGGVRRLGPPGRSSRTEPSAASFFSAVLRRGRLSKWNKQFCDNSPAGGFATPSGHIRSSGLPLPPLPCPIPRLGGCRAIHGHRDGESDIRHKIRIGEACRKCTRYRCRAIEEAPIASDDSCMIVVDGDRRSDFVPGDRSVRLITQLPDRDFVHVIVLRSHRELSILSRCFSVAAPRVDRRAKVACQPKLAAASSPSSLFELRRARFAFVLRGCATRSRRRSVVGPAGLEPATRPL